ncbi:MAG: electron transport complex subunit RsxC [Gammaproteobacteria bacterium]|nr:electron transport complex subunit RsxC [Gammaproteobacteria bacterium]
MRKVWDFHGGIHPPENKHQSLQTPIQQAGIPAELTFPLSQHIGAPAEPVVTLGEHVLKGQLIATADGFISVPKHASTSGIITAVEERPIAHASGLPADCIVLESDGKDEWIEHSGVADYRQLKKSGLLQLIRDAGIAGMGGAGFPAAVKLGVNPEKGSIRTLIINGTECEPYITADDILMRERADEIIRGAEILAHIIEPEETLLGVEDNKPEAIAELRRAAASSAVEIVVFPTKYPSGGEKQLIEILTGKQVPSGGLPADVGIVCQNIGSTVAIYRALVHGEPLISRITTVTGAALQQPQNFEVLLGTPMRYLLEQAGYDQGKNPRLIMGGPMMGFEVPGADVPIVKTTNCVLAPTAAELPTPPPAQACIRCGLCAEACPASLLPQQMYWFAQGKEFEKLETHNLFDCIECGACSYVCPSNIPLVQYYRASKAEIMQLRREHARSEHSRTRFEGRQERLQQEATAREAQRAARKTAVEKRARQTAAGDGEQDLIQAAIERARARKAGKLLTETAAGNADPAEAAIEKAKAARAHASAPSPEEKTRQTLNKLCERLAKSEQKLVESRASGAQDKVIEALEATVVKLGEKITAAETELATYTDASAPGSAPSDTAAVDTAQAAIEKARARQADAAAAPPLSPREQLQKNHEAVEKRLQTVTSKLAEAEQEGSDTVDALHKSIEKLSAKKQQIETALRELGD